MFLIRWFLKFTGIIPGFLVFNPKKYFLGNVKTTLGYRKPAIIAMNHTSFLDYIEAVAMFLFRRVDVLVSESMYNFSPVTRFLLRAMGVIKVSDLTGNVNSTLEAVKSLKKGHMVLIFPEGRIETTKDLYEYKQSVALIAIESGAPVIPIFHDGNVGITKRAKAFIGSEIYAGDHISADMPLTECVAKLTGVIYDKTKCFHDHYYKFFYTKDEKKPKRKKHVNFPYLFVKYTAIPMIKLLIRPRIICQDELARMVLYSKKRLVIISNHTWWIDMPLIYYAFRRRSPRSVAAKDIADKSKGQKMMQKIMGCIFIDRFGYDWASMKMCLDELNNDGALSICPEGVLNFDEKLKEFHTGAAMMAVMTGSPVAPVYINGSYKLLSKTYICVGTPIEWNGGVGNDNIKALNHVMEEKMEEVRLFAVGLTPKNEQDAIQKARMENKEKVSRFG